jgi:hypothetical protein
LSPRSQPNLALAANEIAGILVHNAGQGTEIAVFRSLVVALAALVLVGQGRDRPAEFGQVSGGGRSDTLDALLDDEAPAARWAQRRERTVAMHGPVSEL